jgi:hypothetical protein
MPSRSNVNEKRPILWGLAAMGGHTPGRSATVSLDLACRRGELRHVESFLTTYMLRQTLAIEPQLDKRGEYHWRHPRWPGGVSDEAGTNRKLQKLVNA